MASRVTPPCTGEETSGNIELSRETKKFLCDYCWEEVKLPALSCPCCGVSIEMEHDQEHFLKTRVYHDNATGKTFKVNVFDKNAFLTRRK